MFLQLYSLAKENEKLRVSQCSAGSINQRNGAYAGEQELAFHADGGGIEAFSESLQAGIQFFLHKTNETFLISSCVVKSLQEFVHS